MEAGQVGLIEGDKFEAFNGKPFPAGAGLFMALQSGAVSNASGGGGRGGATINLSVSSPNADPAVVAKIAADQIKSFFAQAGIS